MTCCFIFRSDNFAHQRKLAGNNQLVGNGSRRDLTPSLSCRYQAIALTEVFVSLEELNIEIWKHRSLMEST